MILTILALASGGFFLFGSYLDAKSSSKFGPGFGVLEKTKLFRNSDGSFNVVRYAILTAVAVVAGVVPAVVLDSVEAKAAAMVAFGVLGGRRVWAAKKNQKLIASITASKLRQ